ncbi:MAG: hypothetical protein ACRDGQ_06665 [Candidatus Limnocylindrales bacterium]
MARVSNALFLQVLTATPATGLPIEVDIYKPDGQTMLATLQNAYGVGFQDVLDDVGSGTFTLNANDPKATPANIAKGNIAKIRIGGIYRFAFVMEEPDHIVAAKGGKGDETWLIQGRGVLSLLDRAVVYPLGWPSVTASSTVTYTGPAGSMLHSFLVLAQARGTLPEITFDDWTTVDSLNQPWPDLEIIDFHAGANYLDVAKQLMALGVIDLYMDPNLHLWAFVNRSRDLSTTVVLRAGRHIADDQVHNKKHYSAVKSRVLVEGATKPDTGTPQYEEVIGVIETDPGIGRREGYVAFSSSVDPTTLNQVGVAAILSAAADAEPLQVPVLADSEPGGYVPYVDYTLGDYISLDIPGAYSMAAERVLSMTFAQRSSGTAYTVMLDFNSIYTEALLRIAQRLNGAAGGALATASGTVSAITGPTKLGSPGGAVAASSVVGPDAFGASATAGIASTYSRGDHDHGLPAGFDATVPVTQALGDVASTGTAPVIAHRDHRHGMPALSVATPLVESGTGAPGSGVTPSRDDHVHPAPTAIDCGGA